MEVFRITTSVFDLFGFWGWWELIAALMVAVGCIGELWILLNRLTQHIDEYGKNPSIFWRTLIAIDSKIRPFLLLLKIKGRKISDAKEQLLQRFFVMIVALGVALELIAIPFSLSEVAKLNKETAQAYELAGKSNQRAEIARKEAAAAHEEAAKFSMQAEELRQTNFVLQANLLILRSNVVALESEVQWRTFKPTQKAQIISTLKPLRDANPMVNGAIKVCTFGTDPETYWYAHRICEVLQECGFNAEYIPTLSADSGNAYGLWFLTKKHEPLPPFTKPIILAFKSATVECDWAENDNGEKGILKILVYSKKPK